ncbi:hypothetical protein C8F01DRAFT_1137912 [Mycena amicta]|nr:hypothetical protein C8F01DRAFT_1137912 [Mycena amicta]
MSTPFAPPELWLEVFGALPSESLSSVVATSRSFARLVRPLLFAHFVLRPYAGNLRSGRPFQPTVLLPATSCGASKPCGSTGLLDLGINSRHCPQLPCRSRLRGRGSTHQHRYRSFAICATRYLLRTPPSLQPIEVPVRHLFDQPNHVEDLSRPSALARTVRQHATGRGTCSGPLRAIG